MSQSSKGTENPAVLLSRAATLSLPELPKIDPYHGTILPTVRAYDFRRTNHILVCIFIGIIDMYGYKRVLNPHHVLILDLQHALGRSFSLHQFGLRWCGLHRFDLHHFEGFQHIQISAPYEVNSTRWNNVSQIIALAPLNRF